MAKVVKKKVPEKKKVVSAKVVRAKPVGKVIEKPVPKRTVSKTGGVRLKKRIQTAEGWKREQKRLHAKK
jgi:hypothetical protein